MTNCAYPDCYYAGKDWCEANETFTTGAVRDQAEGKGSPSLIRRELLHRLAVVMEKGADKYAARNWEKGMPLERIYDSAFRHLTMWMEERLTGKKLGDPGDDHLGQLAFNCMALMVIEAGIDDGTYGKELDVQQDR